MTMAERLLKVGSQLPLPALAELRGGLENSVAFSGPPLSIQEKMRHEWEAIYHDSEDC